MGASVTSIAGAPAITRPAVEVGDGGVPDAPVLEYRPEPWGRRDVILFGVLSTIGAVLLGAAWFGSGDGQTINGQVVYIDLAVGGILTGSLGGALQRFGVWRRVASEGRGHFKQRSELA